MYLLQFLLATLVAASQEKRPYIGPRQSKSKITVNLAQKYQTIDGFGTSEAFQRANTIVNLPAEKQRNALDLLFSTTNGAGLTILRNGIGSSPDSSSDHMNTILPKSPGSPSGTPKYVWDGKDSGQLFVAKEAVKYGVTTFYADAWSAPGFMKSSGSDSNGGSLSSTWFQAYANYLVQYVKYYQQEGVNITHLGFLNEPEISTSYASMQSSGSQAADFIKVLYPTLQAANFSNVGIACCDAEGWNDMKSMGAALSSVSSMVAIFTGHGYTSSPTSSLSTTHKAWQTEWADLNGAWQAAWYSSGGAGEGLTWANNIYTGLTSANCSGYLYWIGAQGGNTNSKLIKIENGVVTPSKRLWAYGSYSRTVRPGAVRVGTSGGSGMKITAFRNADGTVAINIINGASAATASIAFSGFEPSTAKAWLTDNTHDFDNVTTDITGETVSASIPARGMVSFVITGTEK